MDYKVKLVIEKIMENRTNGGFHCSPHPVHPRRGGVVVKNIDCDDYGICLRLADGWINWTCVECRAVIAANAPLPQTGQELWNLGLLVFTPVEGSCRGESAVYPTRVAPVILDLMGQLAPTGYCTHRKVQVQPFGEKRCFKRDSGSGEERGSFCFLCYHFGARGMYFQPVLEVLSKMDELRRAFKQKSSGVIADGKDSAGSVRKAEEGQPAQRVYRGQGNRRASGAGGKHQKNSGRHGGFARNHILPAPVYP